MLLSVVLITHNEEANIARTLSSVAPLVNNGVGEVIIVDSGSTDRTLEIAGSLGAKIFQEPWKGFAAQKNSAIDKAVGDWILSLDADEEVEVQLAKAIQLILSKPTGHTEMELRNLLFHPAQEPFPGSLDKTRRLLARPKATSFSQRLWPIPAAGGSREFEGRWIHGSH